MPERLEQVIEKALQKNPANRYTTVGDLAGALLPFGPHRARISVERVHGTLNRAGIVTGPLEPEVLSFDPRSMSDAMLAARRTATPAVWEAPRTKRRSPVVWAAPLALIAAVGVGVYVVRFRSAPPVSAAPETHAPAAAAENPTSAEDMKPALAAPPPRASVTASATATATESASDTESDAPSSHAKGKSRPDRPRLPRATPSVAATVSAAPTAAPAASPPSAAGLFDDPK